MYKEVHMPSLSRTIKGRLKKITNYQYNKLTSLAFIGEGFYICNKEKVLDRWSKRYCYDIHWAYGAALKQYEYPLNCDFTHNKTASGMSIVAIKYNYIKPRYKEFDYTLFKNVIYSQHKYVINNTQVILMTNLDYEIFKDLYDTDAEIYVQWYHSKVGKLNLDDIVDKNYIKKQEIKTSELTDEKKVEEKVKLEACFYGLLARKLENLLNKKGEAYSYIEELRYRFAVGLTDCNKVREKETIIALWQTSYLRYREYKMWKQYKDHVVYMNTDSIYTDIPLHIEKNELGEYDLEHSDVTIFFIRRNMYIVYKDGKPIDYTLGGIEDKILTDKQINELLGPNKCTTAHSKDENGNIIDVKVCYNYIEQYNGRRPYNHI